MSTVRLGACFYDHSPRKKPPRTKDPAAHTAEEARLFLEKRFPVFSRRSEETRPLWRVAVRQTKQSKRHETKEAAKRGPNRKRASSRVLERGRRGFFAGTVCVRASGTEESRQGREERGHVVDVVFILAEIKRLVLVRSRSPCHRKYVIAFWFLGEVERRSWKNRSIWRKLSDET